ncbi:Polyketide synthase 5 [Penicillium rolfsii]|nr:Polyketide synthase 5 [Penicillium rolfsii]
MEPNSPAPALYITGLGSQYPPYLLSPEDLEDLAARFHDVNNPGIKKLLRINRSTGIETRSAVKPYEAGFATQADPPSISEIDRFFRQAGVNLAVQACQKALAEARVSPQQITHTVAVTCTNSGNPGYDFFVARELNLSPHVDRTLLHGVGCAGGLSILRAAAQIAGSASLRRKPARILAFACELCTPNIRQYLSTAERSPDSDQANVAALLFSDAAAAFVLCNEYGIAQDEVVTPQFELVEWGHELVPDTAEHMTFYADIDGYRARLDRDIPRYTKNAIRPMFERLLPSYEEQFRSQSPAEGGLLNPLEICDFDWALHPGGRAIIDGVAEVLQLSETQLQASREIYRTRGNSSSASVLIVLDRLRSQTKKAHVVAASFGPGLAVEMAFLRRCRTNV